VSGCRIIPVSDKGYAPPGGYRKFNYARTFPKLVWRPGVVVVAVFGATTVGVFQAINKKKAITEKFEDVDINNAMEPFLTAERDRYWLKLLKKNRDLEEEIMKDVPGWKTGNLRFLLVTRKYFCCKKW
ncbi:GRIM-19 protein, partial [Ostertagia ostertagi]